MGFLSEILCRETYFGISWGHSRCVSATESHPMWQAEEVTDVWPLFPCSSSLFTFGRTNKFFMQSKTFINNSTCQSVYFSCPRITATAAVLLQLLESTCGPPVPASVMPTRDKVWSAWINPFAKNVMFEWKHFSGNREPFYSSWNHLSKTSVLTIRSLENRHGWIRHPVLYLHCYLKSCLPASQWRQWRSMTHLFH